MDIVISKATPGDAEGIKDVQYRTWLATYPNIESGITIADIEDRFKDRNTPEAIQKQRDRLAKPAEGVTVLVAKEVEKVVGVCAFETVSEYNQLKMLYVLPEYQGKKIGWSLWSEAKKQFDLHNPTYVEVADYNKHAITFYEKIGFKDTGEKITDERFIMKSGARIREMRMKLVQ